MTRGRQCRGPGTARSPPRPLSSRPLSHLHPRPAPPGSQASRRLATLCVCSSGPCEAALSGPDCGPGTRFRGARL